MTYDYTGYEDEPEDTNLAELTRLARLMTEAQVQLDDAERAFKKAQAALKQIQEVDLPEKMEALGIETFTANGLRISIKEKIRANIPSDRVAEALAWLDANGFGALTKHDFKVTYKKGEEDAVRTTRKELEALGVPYSEKRYVHPSPLASFAREQLSDGTELPECFSVHRQQIAKVG